MLSPKKCLLRWADHNNQKPSNRGSDYSILCSTSSMRAQCAHGRRSWRSGGIFTPCIMNFFLNLYSRATLRYALRRDYRDTYKSTFTSLVPLISYLGHSLSLTTKWLYAVCIFTSCPISSSSLPGLERLHENISFWSKCRTAAGQSSRSSSPARIHNASSHL